MFSCPSVNSSKCVSSQRRLKNKKSRNFKGTPHIFDLGGNKHRKLFTITFWTLLWPVLSWLCVFCVSEVLGESGCGILLAEAVAASHTCSASSHALVSSLQAARLLSPALVGKWATPRFQCFLVSLVFQLVFYLWSNFAFFFLIATRPSRTSSSAKHHTAASTSATSLNTQPAQLSLLLLLLLLPWSHLPEPEPLSA